MIKKKDIYIYLHNSDIYKFIYVDVARKRLESILEKKINSDKKIYLCVFFDNRDKEYIGYLNEKEIISLVKNNSMISLLENSFEKLKQDFNNLTEKIYDKLKILISNY